MDNPLLTINQALDILGATPGSILIRTTTGWEALPPGTLGQILVINADGIPEWMDPL